MTTQANENIPVVDVDQAFPAMVDTSRPQSTVSSGDVAATIDAALRTALGWRPRAGDPKAFVDALAASFRLRQVEGHTVADYVPRGYSVQADLGAVTGGQASLYRRAQIARTEMLRILDGLVPLRTDADQQDMDAYRGMVRNAIQRLVDEIGAAGGPRVQMVDQYFRGLTGQQPPTGPVIADNVGGQLGGLRDQFGLIDANVNTIEEEGIRTSFWTLVDLLVDLQNAWNTQSVAFTGSAGQGFLGTDLILISRLMEAAADQVDELESVLDSVLIPASERRTIMLDRSTSLTLDGLLTWLRVFLSDEGRRAAQDSGRDGIVSFVAPTVVQLLRTFRQTLADRITSFGQPGPVQLLPASCCAPLPAGMLAARTRIAVASLCRLLTDLAQTAQRIGRFPRAVLLNVTVKNVATRANTVEVEFRGLNLRPVHIPAFVVGEVPDPSVDCPVVDYGTDGLLLALEGSSTADDESISAFFQKDAVYALMSRILPVGFNPDDGFTVPAEDVATALIDGGLGTVVYAPDPRTYPDLQRLNNPLQPADQSSAWLNVNPNESIKRPVTNPLGGARANVDPNAPTPGSGGGSGGGPGGGSGGGSGGGCGCGCDGRGSHAPCGCGCGCGGGGGPCGCGCDEGEEKDPEVLAHEARMMKLQAERDAELRRLDTERMMLDSADRVNQAKAWNQLLDHRVQAAEKAAAEGREHPKPVGKKGKKGRGCRGDCDQGGGMKSQVAVIIGQLIVLMEQQREAQREASEARLAFGRADGAHLALVARLEKVSGAARSRQQPAVDAALVVRNDAQAEMERWEAKAQDLQTQVETLHIRLREAVVPPVASQDEPGEPAPPAPVTESDTQKER